LTTTLGGGGDGRTGDRCLSVADVRRDLRGRRHDLELETLQALVVRLAAADFQVS